jgi:proline iminopeptidase
LGNPRAYTVDRHIADLESIRLAIHAEQFILVGDSWGATLAANYMAAHPGRCAKTVFTSPGVIEGSEWRALPVYEHAYAQLEAQDWDRKFVAQPRYRRLLEMVADDPRAAYRFAGDGEMDKQFDDLVQRLVPGLVCQREHASHWPKVQGTGWWVNTMVSRDLSRRRTHAIPALQADRTPVLIMRGSCDYLRWEVAHQYKTVFPNSVLLWVPEAGHTIEFDQPVLYESSIRNFLLDHPLPLPHTGDEPPPCQVRYSSRNQVNSATREDCVN